MGCRALIIGAALVAVLASSALAETGVHKGAAMRYRLKVRLDPARHTLEAEAWIQRPPSSRFYLHRGLIAQKVMADGKPVGFHLDKLGSPLPYVPAGTAVVVDGTGFREFYIRYAGEISETTFGCNLVTSDLVELSMFSGWYPVWPGLGDYEFELEVNLPAGYLATTNGARRSQQDRGGRRVAVWQSYAPGFDIVLIASPVLHELEAENSGTRVEVYYSRLHAGFAQSRVAALARAMGRLSALYGPPRVAGMLRLVYSPRDGQGYMRIPLLVISEERARADLEGEFGPERRLRDECHEIAHFWWMLADPATPDDWINEGLAEYSAFRLSEEESGKVFASRRLEEYRRNARACQTTDAIAQTEGSSPDREANRYDKATLMLLAARSRFGDEPLDRLLRSLYARFAGTHELTTARFLEEARAVIGKEAEGFFREELYRESAISPPS